MRRLFATGALLLGLMAAGSCDTGASQGLDPAPATSAAAKSSDTEASAVASALSKLASSPQELAATGSGITPDQARVALPPGTVVSPEPSSWSPDGTGTGGAMRVTVTPVGGQPQAYLAVMVNEFGTWKVLATLPVTVTPSGNSR